jgi:hypothetical protein
VLGLFKSHYFTLSFTLILHHSRFIKIYIALFWSIWRGIQWQTKLNAVDVCLILLLNVYFGEFWRTYKSATKDARKACELGACKLLEELEKEKLIRD